MNKNLPWNSFNVSESSKNQVGFYLLMTKYKMLSSSFILGPKMCCLNRVDFVQKISSNISHASHLVVENL